MSKAPTTTEAQKRAAWEFPALAQVKLPAKKSEAHKWMVAGIKQHQEFLSHFKKTKDAALIAGMFFLSAKVAFEHGEWLLFLKGYEHNVAIRTVQFYMAFADDVIAEVRKRKPKLLGMEDLIQAGQEMVLQSPKALVALARELKQLREFGEYDSVKYRTNQMINSGQLELPLDKIERTLELLCSPKAKLPTDVDEVTKLLAALEKAADRTRQQLHSLKHTATVK